MFRKIKNSKKDGSNLLWVEVAIVDAKIPMLLGNNILKPLGALPCHKNIVNFS